MSCMSVMGFDGRFKAVAGEKLLLFVVVVCFFFGGGGATSAFSAPFASHGYRNLIQVLGVTLIHGYSKFVSVVPCDSETNAHLHNYH